jgi:hypothetical protein
MLAHNLDFWLPHAHQVAENRLRAFPRSAISEHERARIAEIAVPPGVSVHAPRMGGTLWEGEDDSRQVVQALIQSADEGGKLRAIVDAVRSHRVEEDFSDQWSFAREDFERKLYRKRSKVKVRFVELTETIPVHGPESEVIEHILWQDFMGLLNHKEREIVVLLRSGVTHLGDIARHMGYANHSPVSKALSRIRSRALAFLE